MVIYTEFLYISVPGIILSIKPKTIAYMTQLSSLNTCVLHHGYIYRISVCSVAGIILSIKQETIVHIYDPVNVSKYMCITPWFYIQNVCMFQYVPGIILSIKAETIAYMTQLTSLNTCVLHHERIFSFSHI